MRYMNYAGFLLGYKATTIVNRSNLRQSHESVVHILSPRNLSGVKLFGIKATKALRNSGRVEELYVNYSTVYIIPNVKSSSQSRKLFLIFQKAHHRYLYHYLLVI